MTIQAASSTPRPKTRTKPSTAWRAHVGGFAWPTLVLALLCVGSFAGVWVAVLRGQLALGWGLLLNTIVAYVAFTPMHEAAHGNIAGTSRGKWLDSAVGWACSTIFTAPYPGFRAIHLRHHGTTNNPHEDPDAWVAGHSPWSVAARCWTILPHYYHSMLLGSISRTKPGRDVRNTSVVTLTAFIVLTVGLVGAGLGWHALALWWGPALIASGVLALLFDWLPHHPHHRRGRYVDTRAIVGPRVLGWAMLQQNLHLVHHLYPRVPFYAYPQVFAATRHEIEAAGAEVQVLPGARRTPTVPAPVRSSQAAGHQSTTTLGRGTADAARCGVQRSAG